MNTVGRCLERRTMWVSVEMCTNKVIGFVQSIRTAQCIQRQIPQQKIGFSKFCTLRPKWFVLAGSSGTHSVCICSTHQNAVLLIDVIDWECTYKDLMKKVVYDPDNKVCMMHHCESCPGSAALKKFLDDELSHLDMDSEFHYCQWQTTDHAALATLTTTFEEYKELLIDSINNLTWHSYLAKAQARYVK